MVGSEAYFILYGELHGVINSLISRLSLGLFCVWFVVVVVVVRFLFARILSLLIEGVIKSVLGSFPRRSCLGSLSSSPLSRPHPSPLLLFFHRPNCFPICELVLLSTPPTPLFHILLLLPVPSSDHLLPTHEGPASVNHQLPHVWSRYLSHHLFE